MEIAICDYGIGNLRSAEKAFQRLGLDAHLTKNPAELKQARKVVLPGVGAFGACVRELQSHGFVEPLLEAVGAGKPVLGICVGMQMLFESSEENPGISGLKLLKGRVRRFSGAPFSGASSLKVPQIGWNALNFPRPHPLFAGHSNGSYVYFVHSFYAQAENEADVLAWSDYGEKFCAAAGRENVFGVQFHPEKSQSVGLKIIENFGKL